MNTTKKYFLTGLALLLPLVVTVAIVIFIFNLLTAPFVGITQSILGYLGVIDHGFLFLAPGDLTQLLAKILTLIFLFFMTLILGMVASRFVVDSVIALGEKIVHNIPFVNSIYKTCKDVVTTVFSSDRDSFKQVVLVPYPKAGVYALGLLTRESMPILNPQGKGQLMAVFIPTTPNPTSGFLVFYEPDDVQYVDITVEEAFKCIVSLGMVSRECKPNGGQP